MHAVVKAALTPVRASPDVKAEQTSQEVMGSVLRILEESDDWVRVRGEDNYEGWVHGGGLIVGGGERAEAWWDDLGGQPAVALDCTIKIAGGVALLRLPWGARVALRDEGAVLPDGREGRVSDGRVLSWTKLGARFPQDGAAVVGTAREWQGAPYVWGGRTRWGTDCSGFVQAVYRLHGFLLPRDSHQQAEIGELVPYDPDLADLRPGDLLYFRGRGSPQITHVAMSTGGAEILHAAEANGEVGRDNLAGDAPLERSLAARLSVIRRLFR
ncbi:MAG: C40 family peptidase [Gemmatimonadota bacterium]|nr:MAG: C40 family peptidase [Gemmatimonadota bacterium]